ncbi:MAG: ABC transporter ATP-binding protein [Phycisphaerae bacterium]|nr:ABC transporter ATP-binding protein [Gemmatimonadaceae bacterium]
MTAPGTVLEFNDIARSYKKGTPVIDGVTFAMKQGEVLALLGRNAAGKTTLLNLAMGMLFPHRGSVHVFGMSPTDEPVAVKRRLGYVSENQVLPQMARISEIIAFHQHLYAKWDGSLERELLKRFGLDDTNRRISQLSHGQARQVALLCAVCHHPELLIMDEPAGGLDPAARREFLETSIQLLNREGTSILFSSHHMGDVERLGGRVILLDGGRVRVDSDLDALRENYCLAVVPQHSLTHLDDLRKLSGCLGARALTNDWHAVFMGTPAEVRARILTALGVNAHCTLVPLEELFVELVGGDRTVGV